MANVNDEYDDVSIALDVKQKGNVYLVDKIGNARDDYDVASIASDTEQIGYLYCTENENYYSTLDYTRDKLSTVFPPPRLCGVSKNVRTELTENVASSSKQLERVNRKIKCNHNASIVKTQRSIIKLVATLSFAIVAITVASSAYAVIKIKQVRV